MIYFKFVKTKPISGNFSDNWLIVMVLVLNADDSSSIRKQLFFRKV